MTRTLKLKLLDRSKLVSVVTDAETVGDLKVLQEVRELGIDWANDNLS